MVNVNYVEFDDDKEILPMTQAKCWKYWCSIIGLVSYLGWNNHMVGIKYWLFDFDDQFIENFSN